MNIHDMQLLTDGQVYDKTQTDGDIKDGDVFLLSDGRSAFMYRAWPTMVVGQSTVLHSMLSEANFRKDYPKYGPSIDKAREIAKPRYWARAGDLAKLVADGENTLYICREITAPFSDWTEIKFEVREPATTAGVKATSKEK